MKTPIRVFRCLSVLLLAGFPSLTPIQSQAAPFDFDTGSAPVEVIIPQVVPVIFQTIQPGDATLVLRTTTLLTHCWFDAIAPYAANAVGVSSRIERRPVGEEPMGIGISRFCTHLEMCSSACIRTELPNGRPC
jgi:hypothetical protein